jgi:hypothetical protein
MSTQPTLSVRYSRGFAGTIAFLGVALLVLGGLTSNPMSMGLGGMNVLIGALAFAKPVFVVGDGTLAVRNLLGMTLRRLPAVGPKGEPLGFTVENDGALVRWQDPEGRLRQVKIGRFWLRREDFAALATWARTSVFD